MTDKNMHNKIYAIPPANNPNHFINRYAGAAAIITNTKYANIVELYNNILCNVKKGQ